mgnify:CR=1 FL=1
MDRDYTPLFGLVPSPDYIGSRSLMRFEWQDLVDGTSGDTVVSTGG